MTTNPPERYNSAKPKAAEPFTLVVFGASGDLTRRKLMPAVFQLWCQGLLDEGFAVVGFARSSKNDQQFRTELLEASPEAFACRNDPQGACQWDDFASRIFYHQGSYDNPADFNSLRTRIAELSPGRGPTASQNCVFYLATPPAAFEPVISHLGGSGLARRGEQSPWSRVVIEKPFGRDLQSATELNTHVRSVFTEDQVYRIDHYLGKETVQNIMVLRFANSVFEHIWSHDYIDHVQITVAESLPVGRRGGYYDQAGALRDMVQNHMMHLLSLVAMEPPVALTADAIRNEKIKVLESLRPISAECAANGVVRAQYTAGSGEPRAYRDTDGVAADSATETFVAIKVNVDNWRWSGVPFYLRTGKAMPQRCTEISIHFRSVPAVLFNLPPTGPLPPNVLTIRVQPDEGISLEFQVKAPGPAMTIKPLEMDFGYAESFGAAPPDAYERLLLDAAMGDATLFTRSDEAQAAWRFLTPVIEGCCYAGRENMFEYPAGTWGPSEADALIAADGRQWHLR